MDASKYKVFSIEMTVKDNTAIFNLLVIHENELNGFTGV